MTSDPRVVKLLEHQERARSGRRAFQKAVMAVQGDPSTILAAKLEAEQRRAQRESLADRPAALGWPGLEKEPNALGGFMCRDCGAMIKGKLTHAWTCSYWDTPEGKAASPF